MKILSDPELTLLEMLFGRRNKLGGDEFEAALLEAGGDLANKTTVNTIGLEDGAVVQQMIISRRQMATLTMM